MMESIILIGGGGHARSIIDSIVQQGKWKIEGIVDEQSKVGQVVMNIPIIGADDCLGKIYNQGVRNAFIAIGSIGNVELRKKIYRQITQIGFKCPNIIDRTAILADNIELGSGNFIGKGAIINAGSRIGNQTIINSGSIIEHDCIVEDFVHIAPGTTICGGVNIGRESHIGAHSVVIQGKKIGKCTLVGAGSVVVTDINEYKKAYGNPCREVEEWRRYL